MGDATVDLKSPLGRFTRGRRLLLWLNVAAMSIFLLGFLVVANVMAAQHPRRLDLTANRTWDVSEHSKKVVRNLAQEFRIYATPLVGQEYGSDRALPQAWSQTMSLLREMALLNPKLKVTEVSERNPDAQQALAQDFPLAAINHLYFSTTSPAGAPSKKAVNLLECYQGNPQTGEITDFRAEMKIISTIVGLTSERKARIYFVIGHREIIPIARDPRGNGMSIVTNRMAEVENAEFVQLELLKDKAVPKDADAVFIGAPKLDYEVPEIDALREYWKGGGRIFVAWDPQAGTPRGALESFIDELGVRINRDLVVDRQSGLGNPMFHLIRRFGDHPINSNSGAPFRMLVTCSLDQASKRQGQRSGVLMMAPHSAWAESNPNPAQVWQPDTGEKQADIAVAIAAGEPAEKPRTPAAKDSRLVVWGGFWSLTDMGISGPQGVQYSDLEYILNNFRWLLEREQMITTPIQPKSLKMKPLILPKGALDYIWWVSLLLFPVAGAALGVGAWFLRRK